MSMWRHVPYSRRLSKAETTLLVEGFVPRQMEDHWFVFEEDALVHLHRSWTGIEMFAVRLDRLPDGGAHIAEVRMNDEFRPPIPQRPQKMRGWLRRRKAGKSSALSETEILDLFFSSLTRSRGSAESLPEHVYGL
jgi:hypothetical protein